MCGAQEKVGLAIENLPDNEVLNAVKSTVNVKDINYFTVLCLIRNNPLLGPYSRPTPRALWKP